MNSLQFKYFLPLLLLCYAPVSSEESKSENGKVEYFLETVLLPGAPIIKKNKRIMYGLDLVFNKAPQDYWIYYSNTKQMLVLDFYGSFIAGEPQVDLSGRGVFKDVTIENTETNLSLSRQQSKIMIKIEPDPQWHFKGVNISDRVIRITAWKDITGLIQVEPKRNTAIRYIFITTLVSAATFFCVAAINRSTNN